ncbi:LacI family DNA-binding transcriptional regulator [Ruania alba]|uniref:DNA-binding transcriptional regulator, LacI/PurR family n=1 Tax=Ruania alba TaxID=648782 RepID=A0A1H5BC60_9MICO|nr:LacI family DNA-binding transcriptional regulator [Ruania alba]SED52203.1 DNA-binding transcriptional regulator, LacI/PurR family [Ruania alba]
MPATMRDVAKLAGVSVKTVSNVVNNTYPYIRPETRAQVEAAMAELGYRLNVTARKLRTNRTGLIGLALPELRLPYFAELADEVIRKAADVGLKVIVEQVEAAEHVAVESLVGSHTHLVDGAIVAPVGHGDVPSQSAPPGFPVVVLGDHRIGDDVDQVFLANARGAELVMEHLISRGARRIVALGADRGVAVGTEGERTRGYLNTLARHEIAVDEALIRPTEGWSKAAGAAAIRDLTAEGVEFDAVFGFNDTLALGALAELLRGGRRVPQDVQVMGFDDIEDAQYSVPALSTVAVDRSQLAELAVGILVRRLQAVADGDAHPGEVARPGADSAVAWDAIEVPPRLVLRDSTR